MKQLNETQLKENWDKLIQIIDDTFVDTDDDESSISLYEYSSSFEITAVFFGLSCTEFCSKSRIVFMSVIQQILTNHLHM